eukprot:5471367-Lingulodinium_polyedra.AAC.1
MMKTRGRWCGSPWRSAEVRVTVMRQSSPSSCSISRMNHTRKLSLSPLFFFSMPSTFSSTQKSNELLRAKCKHHWPTRAKTWERASAVVTRAPMVLNGGQGGPATKPSTGPSTICARSTLSTSPAVGPT